MPLVQDGYGLLKATEVPVEVLKAFRCGKDHLDTFLVQSPSLHADRLGLTTVVFHRDVDGVVGYFTLANDSLALTYDEQLALNVDVLKAYPAVKLGRLAVSVSLQGQGVGEQLMGLIHGAILDSESLSAARLVIGDADNDPRVVNFYRRMGYENSGWAEDQVRKSSHGGKKSLKQETIKMIRDILAS